MNLPDLTQVIGGKRYSTQNAMVIAHDVYWDGHNNDRHGRNQWLLKTAKGNFFTAHATMWQGERDYLEPVDKDEAKRLYEELPEHELSYEEAFGEIPEEA